MCLRNACVYDMKKISPVALALIFVDSGVNKWPIGKKKVKVTLVQALRLCTGLTARRGSRSIALPFHDHCTRRGGEQLHAPGALYLREGPGTHCTGGCVGPRAGLDRCRKSRLHRYSIPEPSNP